jgi:DNA-binding transcriptional ArsR family regulator
MSDMGVPRHVLLRPGIDRIFESLSNRHRRMILLLLHDGTIETEADVMLRGGDDTKEVETILTHAHLPKLEDMGYIEWDRETGGISKGPRFDEIAPVLDLLENHADELPDDWR